MDEKRKCVTFNLSPKIHHLRTWCFAYRAARRIALETLDHHHFKRRIENTEVVISPILSINHRIKIFKLRFEEKVDQ